MINVVENNLTKRGNGVVDDGIGKVDSAIKGLIKIRTVEARGNDVNGQTLVLLIGVVHLIIRQRIRGILGTDEGNNLDV